MITKVESRLNRASLGTRAGSLHTDSLTAPYEQFRIVFFKALHGHSSNKEQFVVTLCI